MFAGALQRAILLTVDRNGSLIHKSFNEKNPGNIRDITETEADTQGTGRTEWYLPRSEPKAQVQGLGECRAWVVWLRKPILFPKRTSCGPGGTPCWRNCCRASRAPRSCRCCAVSKATGPNWGKASAPWRRRRAPPPWKRRAR